MPQTKPDTTQIQMLTKRNAPTMSPAAKRVKRAVTVSRKKRYVARIPTVVRLGKQAFPKQLINTLSYTELVSVNVTAGTAGLSYAWVANGLYDPNRTGTGHQPLYFDQLIALYNHYTVLRSRISVTIGYPTVVGVNSIVGSLYLDDDNTGKPDALQAAEMPFAKSVMWKPAVDPQPTLYASFDAAKVFGGSPASNDNLYGTASSNPSEVSQFFVQTWDNTLTGATAVQLYVKLEFDVLWDELTTIAVS